MPIKIHDLKPPAGSKSRAKRVGRGIGSRGGKTAGRGHKGQGARGQVAPKFEGGQMPLVQRIPKLRGFTNPFRVEYQGVNLDVIEAIEMTRSARRRSSRHGLGPQGRAGQGARPGRAHPAGHRQGPPVLQGRRSRDHRGRWLGRGAAPAVGRSPPAREGQCPHKPLGRR